mmetsp:Transcript_30928/g.87591  ORF Transcript_30928/g.87591 Transcript_30928/m.87591 type:complete len:204 (+) Transcript_30928:2976-3587(+)
MSAQEAEAGSGEPLVEASDRSPWPPRTGRPAATSPLAKRGLVPPSDCLPNISRSLLGRPAGTVDASCLRATTSLCRKAQRDSATVARIRQLLRSPLRVSSSKESPPPPPPPLPPSMLPSTLLFKAVSCSLSMWISSIIASPTLLCSSRLATTLFLMFRALEVYLRVLRVSSMLESAGLTHAIIMVRAFPPRLSCSKRVSLLER